MLTIAYLANEFPCVVEPYVGEEIDELRKRGIRVVTASVRRPRVNGIEESPDLVLQSAGVLVLARAIWLCLRRWRRISPWMFRIVLRGTERPWQRAKALLHTVCGAGYAVMLQRHQVEHIHVHHGYFGCWIAMTAARLLDVGFSMTLHGSDLLLNEGAYLDVKLAYCSFCLTISEYNRNFILQRYPAVNPRKIVVARLGVAVAANGPPAASAAGRTEKDPLNLLAVGRLHAVKDHAFLVRACAELYVRKVPFHCVIAGDGEERRHLQDLIQQCALERQVTLLGEVPRERLAGLYRRADVIVLTSRSEGIPLVLMEAMAQGKIVLAPAITGIPELVLPGKSGFLYQAGAMRDLLGQMLLIEWLMRARSRCGDSDSPPYCVWAESQLDCIQRGAHEQISKNFNRCKNLEAFGNLFLERISARAESVPNENLVLQQI